MEHAQGPVTPVVQLSQKASKNFTTATELHTVLNKSPVGWTFGLPPTAIGACANVTNNV